MAKLAINGGAKACDYSFPKWPIWDETDKKGLIEVLESGQWWYGKKVKEFEQKYAEVQDAKFGVTCSSGTTAIEAALLALGVGAGDEVIVPPYTFMATASAVLKANAVPVFADIDGDSLCIDPVDVEKKITDKTKCIIPVHLGGHIADMDKLSAIAKKHKLFILEDACHSWGGKWKGKGTGALGNCGVFSFQASKNLNSAEGGIILTDDAELADLVRSYTNCGRGKDKPWYEHYLLGSNLRITEFHAALLLSQLTRLKEQTLKREANANILNKGFEKIPGIKAIQKDPRITRHAYHLFCFRVDKKKIGMPEEKFIAALKAEGVPCGKGYDRPLYKNPLFQRKEKGVKGCPISCPYYGREMDYTKVKCPVCEQVVVDTVWIYQSAMLAEEKAMHMIIDSIKKVIENASEVK
jgi:dTDP-4-amino-4,6-dideoxygalactose transaminase